MSTVPNRSDEKGRTAVVTPLVPVEAGISSTIEQSKAVDKGKPGGAASPVAIPATIPAAIEGRLDTIAGGRAYGWAWDRARPETALEIEIRLGDRLLARARADRPRDDLAKSGFGDGRHAFEADLLEEVAADRLSVTARCPRTGATAALTVVGGAAEGEAVALGAVLGPQLSRLGGLLDAVRQEQRQLLHGQQAALKTAKDLAQRLSAADQPGAPALLARALDELAAGQERLAERVAGLEVFLVRIDEALRSRSPQPGPAQTAPAAARPALSLSAALTGLAVLAAAGLGALLFALVQP